MKRKVSVYAGVMAAMVAVSASAEEQQVAPAPAEPSAVAPAPAAAPAPAPAAAPASAPAMASAQPMVSAAPTVAADAPVVASASGTVEARAAQGEKHVPFNFSVVPGLSTNGVEGGDVVNNVALGLIGTRSGRLDGVAMALVGTWVDRTVSGAQLSVALNYAGGHVGGAQFATGLNLAGSSLSGLQSSVGLNFVRENLSGAQLATGLNIAGGGVRGLQGAVGLNLAGEDLVGAQFVTGVNIVRGNARGLQASAGLNLAPGSMVGLQASAGVSYAGRIDGAQLSIVNVGGEVDGAQVGLVNVANKTKGLQLGLVNVAAHSEGEAVGLLSFIGNGLFNVQAWSSDLAVANVGLKLGGRHLYTLLTVGAQPGTTETRRRYLTGLGFGGHIPMDRFFLDIELLGSNLHVNRILAEPSALVGQLRLIAGWQLAPRFAIIGGLTGNTLVSWKGDRWEELGVGRDLDWSHTHRDTHVRVWPGALLGIQI
ncbi:hypothetical protein P2318_02360 [Myxococcaceae bacterium GXIMD 01537]